MIKNILISLDHPVINLYFIFTFIVLCFTFAGIQDMLPQNMAPWHIKYFKLKESEKQQAQARFSELPPKQVLRSSQERCLSYTQEKRSSLTLEDRDAERNLNEQNLLFPPVYYT